MKKEERKKGGDKRKDRQRWAIGGPVAFTEPALGAKRLLKLEDSGAKEHNGVRN